MIHTNLIVPVSELLARQAKTFPGKVAFSDAARAITYAELDRQTENLATRLRADYSWS